ncbi:MAG: acylneuraminate cytidylyltransferase family protein [Candidatus Omnitrophota bacterium]|nr:acylneuraminate cytidylyltransferase family protein [Candidatus Omnitrophota bacterium]
MEVIAIIPARGGSKGIPGKNVKLLVGKPLIAHTIEHALEASVISRIVVSTDNNEIANISREYGAEVILRPTEISGDVSPSELALLHAIEYLREKEGYQPQITVFLQCTSPLITPEDIDNTVQLLLKTDADSALSVTPIHCFLWKINEQREAVGINHDERIRLRRQDREKQYLETGAIYAMRTKGFLKAKYRFFGKIVLYEIPPERSLEIDKLIDFHIAETLFIQGKKDNKQAG